MWDYNLNIKEVKKKKTTERGGFLIKHTHTHIHSPLKRANEPNWVKMQCGCTNGVWGSLNRLPVHRREDGIWEPLLIHAASVTVFMPEPKLWAPFPALSAWASFTFHSVTCESITASHYLTTFQLAKCTTEETRRGGFLGLHMYILHRSSRAESWGRTVTVSSFPRRQTAALTVLLPAFP